MGNISSWLRDVSSEVPGATKPVIDAAVRSVIRSFCEDTLLYVRELTSISIVASTVEYTLTPPANTAIVMVEHITCQDQPIYPDSADTLDRGTDNWRDQEASGQTNYLADVEKVLRLRYIPTESIANALRVWVSLKPSATTDTVPDFIVDDWYDCILDGVKARLFRQTGKSWTNLEAAEYYEKEYRARKSKAKKRKYTGITKLGSKVADAPFSVVG